MYISTTYWCYLCAGSAAATAAAAAKMSWKSFFKTSFLVVNQSYSPLQSSLSSTGQSTHTLCVSPLERKKNKNEKNRRTISLFFFYDDCNSTLDECGKWLTFFSSIYSVYFSTAHHQHLWTNTQDFLALTGSGTDVLCSALCFLPKGFYDVYIRCFGWRLGSIRCWTTHTQHIVLPYTTSWLL